MKYSLLFLLLISTLISTAQLQLKQVRSLTNNNSMNQWIYVTVHHRDTIYIQDNADTIYLRPCDTINPKPTHVDSTVNSSEDLKLVDIMDGLNVVGLSTTSAGKGCNCVYSRNKRKYIPTKHAKFQSRKHIKKKSKKKKLIKSPIKVVKVNVAASVCIPDTIRGIIIYNDGHLTWTDGNISTFGYWIGCEATMIPVNSQAFIPAVYKKTTIVKENGKWEVETIRKSWGRFVDSDFKTIPKRMVYGLLIN